MNISMGEGLLVALSGIFITFLLLGALSVIVWLLSKVLTAGDKKSAPAAETAAVATAPAPVTGAYGGDVLLFDVDEKTAACVMAIISHETQIPLNELVFKSIRAI